MGLLELDIALKLLNAVVYWFSVWFTVGRSTRSLKNFVERKLLDFRNDINNMSEYFVTRDDFNRQMARLVASLKEVQANLQILEVHVEDLYKALEKDLEKLEKELKEIKENGCNKL